MSTKVFEHGNCIYGGNSHRMTKKYLLCLNISTDDADV